MLGVLRRQIEEVILRHVGAGRGGPTVVPGLSFGCLRAPLPPTTYTYEPSLCLCVRGSKRVTLGERTLTYDQDRFQLNAVDVPTIVAVDRASRSEPHVGLQIHLDLDLARQLIAEMSSLRFDAEATDPCIVTGPITDDLLEPVWRLVRLLDEPRDIAILSRSIHREILYRVLSGPKGGRLREIARLDSQGHRIAKVVAWMRANYTEKVRIQHLARVAGMGVSTLHRHFNELMAMSPLQFQKELRLHEARRLLLDEDLDAGTAAIRVGYDSSTQFSREYRRRFGRPPRRDVRTLRGLPSPPRAAAR